MRLGTEGESDELMQHWQKVTVEVGQQEHVEKSGRSRKTRKIAKKRIFLVACILLLLFGSTTVLSVFLYQTSNATYHRSLATAQQGMQHIRVAEKFLTELQHNPFDANAVSQARQAFVAAESDFEQLQSTMQTVPGISTLMPVYGPRIAAAMHLIPLAVAGTQAGIAGCDVLNLLIMRYHDPFQPHGSGLTNADFSSIDADFSKIKAALTIVVDEAKQIQPGDVQFYAGLSQMIVTLQQNLPTIQAWVDTAAQLLPVLPTLIGVGSPTNYLIEVLDSTELRPGGGFVGNYGVASLSGGRLLAAHITDVDLLDYPFDASGKAIAYPPQYQWFARYLSPKSWSLRDSDLDADFPATARYAEQNYQIEGGKTAFQGVVAMTPLLIEQVLTITGPISVPEYNETVTAQNLIARIHFHQLGGSAAGEGSDRIPSPDGHSSLRKRFTELLSEHLLARIRQLPSSTQFKLLQAILHAVQTKDLQIYLNSAAAEQALHQAHLDDSIQAMPGDSLMVVDANVSPNKANSFIVNTLNDEVTIDTAGNALHHTTLNYAWILPGKNYGSALYRDYVQVYLPAGSVIQNQQGWLPEGTGTAFGRKVLAGYIAFHYKQTRTVTLTWMSPHAATNNASGWHYQDFVQHQASTRWQLHLHITLPSCATMLSRQGGLVASNRQTMMLNRVMDEDFTVGTDYTC